MKTVEEIEKDTLINARERLIVELTTRKIDQSYFRMESILANRPKENEEKLAGVTSDIVRMESVLKIIEDKLKDLK